MAEKRSDIFTRKTIITVWKQFNHKLQHIMLDILHGQTIFARIISSIQ